MIPEVDYEEGRSYECPVCNDSMAERAYGRTPYHFLVKCSDGKCGGTLTLPIKQVIDIKGKSVTEIMMGKTPMVELECNT